MSSVKSSTYKYERLRALSSGVLETSTTFLLLLAVQVFSADATSKGLIAAGGSFGLLLGPLVVSRAESSGWKVTHAASLLSLIGAASFLIAFSIRSFPIFLTCSIIGSACASASIPLLIQMYQENYSNEERGKMFTNSFLYRIAVSIFFSQAAGYFLSKDLHHYPWLLLAFATAYLFSSFCLQQCPSKPLTKNKSSHPLRSFRVVKEDPTFRWTLYCWMLMGFANLMALPLRVEHLANPHQGMGMSPEKVAFLLGVVPNAARLIMSRVWGQLFDRVNFFVLRMILNFGFMLGIITFFMGNSFENLFIGAVFYGIANAGGDVAWSLWVTKLAPSDRVADYMAVHTFLTGVRGILAPILSLQLVSMVSLQTMGWINAGMILIATLMLLPEVKSGRKKIRTVSTVKEFSE